LNGPIGHATRAFRNAFFSPGFRLFGLRFSRDYLRFAWRAIGSWGNTGPGTLKLLGFEVEYANQTHALFLVHELFVNTAYTFSSPDRHPRIVDCGANIGMSVLFFKALRPDADVIAFEPDPVTCAHLVRTVESNGLRNVRIENAAVGGHEGTVTFYSSASDPASLSASIEPTAGGEMKTSVRMVRLSSFLTDRVDLLKLDVEGAEYSVIDDLIATGTMHLIREAVIEYHEIPSRPDGVAYLTRTLQSEGFEVALINTEQRNGVVRARRRSITTHDQPPAG
jgi:FkbM family methyltransferase